jgi:hypothetical protein
MHCYNWAVWKGASEELLKMVLKILTQCLDVWQNIWELIRLRRGEIVLSVVLFQHSPDVSNVSPELGTEHIGWCANCCQVFSLVPCLPVCTGHVLWTCPVHRTFAPDINSREGVLGALWAFCVHRTYPMLHQTCAPDRSSREHVVVRFGCCEHRTCPVCTRHVSAQWLFFHPLEYSSWGYSVWSLVVHPVHPQPRQLLPNV